MNNFYSLILALFVMASVATSVVNFVIFLSYVAQSERLEYKLLQIEYEAKKNHVQN